MSQRIETACNRCGAKRELICKAMTDRDRLIELLADYLYSEQIADHLIANGVIVKPCKVGSWLWYIYRSEINKAKVEEIHYDASKHGYYSYSFTVYAWDFKNKRQVIYYPINETTKNKSNINEVDGMDLGEDVYIFLTREKAEKALNEKPMMSHTGSHFHNRRRR